MGVLVVGQRDECVRDDDEVCGQEMPLVCQWRTLLYSRQRPTMGVLVDCAPRLHGHELASPAHPPRGSASDAPPPRQRSVRPPTRPQLLPLEPPTPPLRCTSSVPTAHRRCRVPHLPARGLRRPLQGVPPATQRTATKSRPTAPHCRARGGRHQPPPEPAAAGGMGGEEPRRRTSLSALCRLAPCSTPPAVGGPPARSSPSPRKVRNRPLPTRDSHGRKMPRRRRADPPRAPPTARSQSGLCCRVGWGTPHPLPTCRLEDTPWVPCAGAGSSAGRVGPSGATSSASLAVATPRHPEGLWTSLLDTPQRRSRNTALGCIGGTKILHVVRETGSSLIGRCLCKALWKDQPRSRHSLRVLKTALTTRWSRARVLQEQKKSHDSVGLQRRPLIRLALRPGAGHPRDHHDDEVEGLSASG